jgi:hypothetical protein
LYGTFSAKKKKKNEMGSKGSKVHKTGIHSVPSFKDPRQNPSAKNLDSSILPGVLIVFFE